MAMILRVQDYCTSCIQLQNRETERHLLLRKRARNSNLDFTVADILMLPII